MSWSISINEVHQHDVGQLLREEIERYFNAGFGGDHAVAESREQAVAAADAAKVAAVKIGHKHVNVTISGHANPNHEQAEGYSDEFVSIAISETHPVPVLDSGTAAGQAAAVEAEQPAEAESETIGEPEPGDGEAALTSDVSGYVATGTNLEMEELAATDAAASEDA